MNHHTHRIMPIVQAASEECGVGVRAILGRSRKREDAMARHLTMYVARTRFGWSFRRIAAAFGGLDHAAVMSGVRKIEQLQQTHQHTREVIHNLFTTI